MIPILIALVGGTVAGILWVTDKGLAWWWIALYAIVVILFIVFSFLAYRKVALERDKHKLGQFHGVEFYDSREALEKQRTLREQLESAKEVWGFWRTGTEVYVTQTIQSGRIKRLILPHPQGQGVELMADALGKKKEDFAAEIIKLTKEAIEARVSVRWFEGWVGNTLMIGNPHSENAWIHVETFFPFSVSKDWPAFRVERQKLQRLFSTLLGSYQQIWDESHPPPQSIMQTR